MLTALRVLATGVDSRLLCPAVFNIVGVDAPLYGFFGYESSTCAGLAFPTADHDLTSKLNCAMAHVGRWVISAEK